MIADGTECSMCARLAEILIEAVANSGDMHRMHEVKPYAYKYLLPFKGARTLATQPDMSPDDAFKSEKFALDLMFGFMDALLKQQGDTQAEHVD